MNNEAGLDWDTDLIKMGDSDTYIPSPTPPSNLIGIQHTYNPTRPIIFISFHMIQFTKTYNTFYLGAGIHRHVQYCVVCTRMVTDPSWAEAHLNDIRFNSNWVFFHSWWLSEDRYSISEVFENSQIWPYWRRYIQFWKLQVEFVVKKSI